MRIKDVIRGKSDAAVVTITPDATVRQLIGILAEHNIGAVIVSSDGSAVDGIVSERDVVRRLGDDDGGLLERRVDSIMTTDVETCTADDAVDDLMQVMTQRRIRHLPVVADGALVGIISIGDVVKSRIGELEFERDQLDSYVHQQ
jgi:CBS domain-containing protein